MKKTLTLLRSENPYTGTQTVRNYATSIPYSLTGTVRNQFSGGRWCTHTENSLHSLHANHKTAERFFSNYWLLEVSRFTVRSVRRKELDATSCNLIHWAVKPFSAPRGGPEVAR
jgi:hypothetical protein